MSAHSRTGRRGFLRIAAAAAAGALCPGLARGATPSWRWVGSALGARASITVHHPDRGESRRIVGFDVCELAPAEGPVACSYTAARLVAKLAAYSTLC